MEFLNENPNLLGAIVLFAIIGVVSLGKIVVNNLKLNPPKIDPNCEEIRNNMEGLINLQTAKLMYAEYETNEIQHIERKLQIEDSTMERSARSNRAKSDFSAHSRFGYYSYEDFKKYMAYLECINAHMESNKKDKIGIKNIRFYFSRYPQKYYAKGSEKSRYNNQNSLFILPTTIIDGVEHGFCINREEGIDQYDSIIDNLENNNAKSLILNEIGLTPPPREELLDFG